MSYLSSPPPWCLGKAHCTPNVGTVHGFLCVVLGILCQVLQDLDHKYSDSSMPSQDPLYFSYKHKQHNRTVQWYYSSTDWGCNNKNQNVSQSMRYSINYDTFCFRSSCRKLRLWEMKEIYQVALVNGKGLCPHTGCFTLANHKTLTTPIHFRWNHGISPVLVTLVACWKGPQVKYSRNSPTGPQSSFHRPVLQLYPYLQSLVYWSQNMKQPVYLERQHFSDIML